jgi:predicted transposase/invertase (TIGR01784 family)
MDAYRVILPVKDDIIFRLFFADERHTDELIRFLKSVLSLPDEEYEILDILDPHLLREFDGDKLGVVDVKLKTKNNKIIHIEIQLQVTSDFCERAVYYTSKLVTEQVGSGDRRYDIKKVISIIITEEELIKGGAAYHHCFRLYDHVQKIEFTDVIEIHTLELNKLPTDPDGTELYDWARFIAADTEEELNMIAERNPQFTKSVVRLRELSADEKTRDLYERREKARLDESSRTYDAVAKVALNLLRRNRPISEIIEDTGLTLEEINALA